MARPLSNRWAMALLAAWTLILGCLPPAVEAASFRLRAREHFEWLSARYGPVNETQGYFGLTNTLNAWYEEPFRYAFGLAFGPLLGSARSRGTAPAGTASKIRLWNVGLEGKYFFRQVQAGLFGRAGLTANLLDTRGALGTLLGGGYYLGLGWEWQVRKMGIAPEIAFRHVILEKNSRVLAFTPSIGFHFYMLPKDEGEKPAVTQQSKQ